MQIEQKKWGVAEGWTSTKSDAVLNSAHLVLAFGSRDILSEVSRFAELKEFYPSAHIVLCSTAGEIQGSKVLNNSLVSTAVHFEKTEILVAKESIKDKADSFSTGQKLVRKLSRENLVHILVISDGQLVNGSELVVGLNSESGLKIPITGGLAGDGSLFQKTLVGLNEAPKEGQVVAVGFYGSDLKVGHGSFGGWDSFGPERIVTSSDKNVLYELDNQSALQLYKKYLGPLSADLPSSALLFPLAILQDKSEVLVRTVLSVNESDQSMTFAGDVPLNSKVRLMKANFERLIDGSASAAKTSLVGLLSEKPELAMFISCVGRKLVLSHRVEEEVEEATKLFDTSTSVSGFYSYGEISPLAGSVDCELHNQTMTITTYSES